MKYCNKIEAFSENLIDLVVKSLNISFINLLKTDFSNVKQIKVSNLKKLADVYDVPVIDLLARYFHLRTTT